QLDLINVRADFLDRIINSVMILHMGLRALNRLTRQLYIPISHHRLLSKGEYPSRHQDVSSFKDTGQLFLRLITATIRIRWIAITIRECFALTIHGESLNRDGIPDHVRVHELDFTRSRQLALRDYFTNTGTTIKHVQNEC